MTLFPIAARADGAPPELQNATVRHFGAMGDGQADDTDAIQRAVDARVGCVRFPPGTYRLTRPVVVELDRVGFTALVGDTVARVVMEGSGPAFRFVGTHGGTAAPRTVKDNVWAKQRMPSIDGLEIIGRHAEACGVEATGTMQLTITRLTVRGASDAVRLVERNRNVTISECHLYENRGAGILLDRANLHQINVVNCHISYNEGGGVVARESEVRNLQIGSCDIESNTGRPESPPTANVWLDSTGGSLAEIAIVGCTIQHAHDVPGSANIRFNGRTAPRKYTDETRVGNLTIADNVLSDVHVNIDLRNARGVTITGNTLWQGYTRNVQIDGCANVVIANNVFDRNPWYHSGDAAAARLGMVLTNSSDLTLSANQICGLGEAPAAIEVRECRRVNITGCTIVDYGRCGLLLENVSDSRVSDCLIREDRAGVRQGALRWTGGSGNMVVDNLLDAAPMIDERVAVVKGNVHPNQAAE